MGVISEKKSFPEITDHSSGSFRCLSLLQLNSPENGVAGPVENKFITREFSRGCFDAVINHKKNIERSYL